MVSASSKADTVKEELEDTMSRVEQAKVDTLFVICALDIL